MAIYRDFRPQTFDEVLGQDSTVSVLKNQIKTGNISHAYIFSGIRGSGKTSSAKIFSRAVNCLNPQDGNPCNECEACKSILNGETIDVVEMDAASNRKIDDIRDLREKVMYPPSFLKYKVYIIDEAHMITNEAFNALLKIMEDAPSHLIFILATTELSKIPETIQSRCQRFNFQRINDDVIAYSLKNISRDLGYEISDPAIEQIVKAAGGALRDGQSILDKVISSSTKKTIDEEDAARAIGLTESYLVRDLARMVLNKDLKSAFELIDKIYSEVLDTKDLLSSLMETFRGLLLYKYGITGDASEEDLKLYEEYKDVSEEKLIFFIDTLLEEEIRIKTYELKRVILESALVKLVNFESSKDLNMRLTALEEKLESGVSLGFSNIPNRKETYEFEEKGIPEKKAENLGIKSLGMPKEVRNEISGNSSVEDGPGKNVANRIERKEEETTNTSKAEKVESQDGGGEESPVNEDLLRNFNLIFTDFLEKRGKMDPLKKSIISRIKPMKIEDGVIYLSFDIDMARDLVKEYESDFLEDLEARFGEKYSIGKYEAEPSIKDDLLNYFEGEITFK